MQPEQLKYTAGRREMANPAFLATATFKEGQQLQKGSSNYADLRLFRVENRHEGAWGDPLS